MVHVVKLGSSLFEDFNCFWKCFHRFMIDVVYGYGKAQKIFFVPIFLIATTYDNSREQLRIIVILISFLSHIRIQIIMRLVKFITRLMFLFRVRWKIVLLLNFSELVLSWLIIIEFLVQNYVFLSLHLVEFHRLISSLNNPFTIIS